MAQKQAGDIRYEVITQTDPSSDDILIPIPPALLAQLGWKEGDSVYIGLDDTGRYVLKRTP